MTNQKPNLISIVELAALFGFKKNTLHFYYSMGLLESAYSAKGRGGIILFNKETAIKRIKIIMKLKKEGKELKEIAELFKQNDKNN